MAKDKKDEQQSFVCMWVSDLVQLSGQVFLVGPFVAFFSFICMHAQEAKVQNRSQIAADSFLANKLWIGQVVNGT
uniref:Uncharacterized protein n=1 Tax=Nymphaea colorata TaxID=210225 RepID=A0A5K1E811_9MAGN